MISAILLGILGILIGFVAGVAFLGSYDLAKSVLKVLIASEPFGVRFKAAARGLVYLTMWLIGLFLVTTAGLLPDSTRLMFQIAFTLMFARGAIDRISGRGGDDISDELLDRYRKKVKSSPAK